MLRPLWTCWSNLFYHIRYIVLYIVCVCFCRNTKVKGMNGMKDTGMAKQGSQSGTRMRECMKMAKDMDTAHTGYSSSNVWYDGVDVWWRGECVMMGWIRVHNMVTPYIWWGCYGGWNLQVYIPSWWPMYIIYCLMMGWGYYGSCIFVPCMGGPPSSSSFIVTEILTTCKPVTQPCHVMQTISMFNA